MKKSQAEKTPREIDLYDEIKEFKHYCRECTHTEYCGFFVGLFNLSRKYENLGIGLSPTTNQMSRTIAFNCRYFKEKTNE